MKMGYVDLPLDGHTSLYSIPGATPLKTILSASHFPQLEGAKGAHAGVEKTNDDFDPAVTIEPYRSAFCRSRRGGGCTLACGG